MEVTIVVLPTPGPPVITITLETRPWSFTAKEAPEALGDTSLGSVQANQKNAFCVAGTVGNNGIVRKLELKSGANKVLCYLEQGFREWHELIPRQAAMTLIHRLCERVGDAGADPDHGRLLDAELHRDGIGDLEPDASDVAGQPVWVLRHHLNRIGAVGLEDAHCTRRPNPVAVQKYHDLANDLLLGPGGGDPLRADGADSGDLAQTIWFGLDDVENLVGKCTDELFGVNRSDTPDHAGAEVLFDALD
jgi:hypothetical protein